MPDYVRLDGIVHWIKFDETNIQSVYEVRFLLWLLLSINVLFDWLHISIIKWITDNFWWTVEKSIIFFDLMHVTEFAQK